MTTTRGLGEFQCSSASRKFLNGDGTHHRRAAGAWFQCSSASRKFLNVAEDDRQRRLHLFQCSSASRKFLNCALPRSRFRTSVGFSALQRAENSSITRFAHLIRAPSACFSALQRAENSSIRDRQQLLPAQSPTFQCSSASRKFLNADPRTCVHPYFRPR